MALIPPFLDKNDTVAIVATAKKVNKADIKAGIKILESWGLNVIEGESIYKEHYEFAGSDAERLKDIDNALNNSKVKAIFCARGGYGTARIIDQIDFSGLMANPKWLIGFSDVTVLLSHLQKLDIASIHGPMPQLFSGKTTKEALSQLKDTLFGIPPSYTIKSSLYNKIGTAHAPIIGGNLSIINSLAGTPSDIDTDGKILFIEEIDEYLYQVDRMMVTLKRSGKLKTLKGLFVGHMTGIKDNVSPFGKNFYEIILDAVSDYDYPVMFDFPAGHEPNNMPLIFGQSAMMNIEQDHSRLTFAKNA
jgi:muramoyltetrapeptide carboxypeptidase